MKTYKNETTGLASPPIAPCIHLPENSGLKCPYRLDTESKFECLPESCDHRLRRQETLRRSYQAKMDTK